MRAKYYLLSTFLFISIVGLSQKSYWTISGSIIAAKKVQAQSAKVFVNNTSIGTSTNENGSFQLNIPNNFSQIDLVILYVGNKEIKRKINYSPEIQVFKFQLEESNLSNSVMSSPIPDKHWREKWRIFENALLGDSKFARNCEILNPEVIKLEFDKDNKVITTASKPIIIRNNALGYEILYNIDKMVCVGTSSYFSGTKFFKKIETNRVSIKGKWENNRRRIFSESFRNFLIALSINQLEENDFEIYKMADAKSVFNRQTTLANAIKDSVLAKTDPNEICKYDNDSESFVIQSENPLLVFVRNSFHQKPLFADFPYKYSEIILPKGYAEFTEDGILIRPNDIIKKANKGLEGFATMLPDDYYNKRHVTQTSEPKTITKID